MTSPFSLTTPRETLLTAVERKNTIPVLANLLLEAAPEGGLRIGERRQP